MQCFVLIDECPDTKLMRHWRLMPKIRGKYRTLKTREYLKRVKTMLRHSRNSMLEIISN